MLLAQESAQEASVEGGGGSAVDGAGLELNWNLAVSGGSGSGLTTFCTVVQRLLRAYGALSRDAFVVLDAARLVADEGAADVVRAAFVESAAGGAVLIDTARGGPGTAAARPPG